MNTHEILQLNIINSEFFSPNNTDFFIEEFITLANLDNINIIKVFKFGLIYSIDNKRVKKNDYFYTNKFIENNMNFNELIS